MNTEQPVRNHRRIEIEVCERDLRSMADEWQKHISTSSEDDKLSNWPNLLREAVETKWKQYMALTNNTPDPEVEKRVRSIAMVNLI